MSSQVEFSLEGGDDSESDSITCRVQINDQELFGHEGTFKLKANIKVHDSRGIDESTVLFEKKFQIKQPLEVFTIPRKSIRAYSYNGRMIDMEVHTVLEVDDAMIFDTTVSEEQELKIGLKPPVRTDASAIVEPGDSFFFYSNLKAIPIGNQLMTIGLAAVGAIVIALNMTIGTHDQFVPEASVYFYDHTDSDGDSESPFMKALMGSGAIGTALWFAIKDQLRRYMTFRLGKLPERLQPEKEYRASDFFTGRSKVPLENVTLRFVASNMEHGQYERGSGTDRRTVSFSEPIRGVVIFEKTVPSIPAKMPIAPYFNDRVSFTTMFELLYPPYMTSSTHGMNVHWEIQLLHPLFVDQEIIGPKERFKYEDFLRS